MVKCKEMTLIWPSPHEQSLLEAFFPSFHRVFIICEFLWIVVRLKAVAATLLIQIQLTLNVNVNATRQVKSSYRAINVVHSVATESKVGSRGFVRLDGFQGRTAAWDRCYPTYCG